MALATADRTARPALRFVLMKQVDERGVVFFTNTESRKGRELHANPRAALTFYWSALGKQVRFADLAAAASRQSAALSSRAALMGRYRDLEERYRGVEVPRPPQWSGFRLVPDAIEFWIHAEHRLHRRELFVRRAGRWRSTLLQP